MTFAKTVFIAAGVWGIVTLTPLFFLVDVTGRHYAFPATYPQFFYGFFAVAMAWQFAFLVIGSNPLRFRPLMLAAIVEKVGFIATAAALLSKGSIPATDASAAIPDLVLCSLFAIAFAKTAVSNRLAG